ncbi:MAG TPA: lysylphosphatidylglycerol synthase transmembrane domain-containing protein [Polyangiaceae bacterium]|nr:lysylphosphatidylglycerol synthase transmembrane domain-containing protein [Polyangiaceae bacterium]
MNERPGTGRVDVTRKYVPRLVATVLVVAGGVGLASTLGRIDWATFAGALANVSVKALAFALCLSTVQVFAQLARFAVIFRRTERPPLRELLDATAVGQLLNFTTPMRAGDAYKLARLAPGGETPGTPLGALAAALVVERVADIAALLLVAAPALGSLGEVLISPAHTREAIPRVALALALGVVAGAVVVRRRPPFAARFARDAWQILASPRFGLCLFVALVTWVLDAGTLCWTARSAGSPIGLGAAIPCVLLLNVGIALPLTVANLGIFEASLAFGLSLEGIGAERALVIATLEHFVTLAGLVVCVGALKVVPRHRR